MGAPRPAHLLPTLSPGSRKCLLGSLGSHPLQSEHLLLDLHLAFGGVGTPREEGACPGTCRGRCRAAPQASFLFSWGLSSASLSSPTSWAWAGDCLVLKTLLPFLLKAPVTKEMPPPACTSSVPSSGDRIAGSQSGLLISLIRTCQMIF